LSGTFLIGAGLMLVLMVVAAVLFPEQITTEAPLDLGPSEAMATGEATAEEPVIEIAPGKPVDVPGVPIEPVAIIPVAIDGVVFPGEYGHRTDAGGFEVHWSNDINFLRVGLVSPGTGYVAIGFDPDHRMKGANFILGAVEDGRLVVRDDYGDGSVTHTADTLLGGTNDILEAAGREEGGRTTVEFVIPLATRDAMDKTLVPGETYDILVAYHNTSDSFAVRHSRRGSGTIRLDAVP
jgi:hypothetical protein